MSFAKLKRNRDQIAKLQQAANEQGGGRKSYVDDRIWSPVLDKAGNGYAVIRFLPAAEGSEVPWVRYWDHGFQGPTGLWYIEKSLTSIGQPDPVSERNSFLWDTGLEENKEIVRKQKRRLHYVSNIYVVSDPSNPANEGKVFLFKFGKKIFDKIMDVMNPQFDDEEPVNPFDFWEGANFKLKIRQVEGYRNYDKSEFASTGPLSDDDDELEQIYNKMYDLNEFLDPKTYKSYDELKARMNKVLLLEEKKSVQQMIELDDEIDPPKIKRSEPEMTKTDVDDDVFGGSDDDADDNLSFFEKLANED